MVKKSGIKYIVFSILIMFATLVSTIQPVSAVLNVKDQPKYQIRVDLTENLVFIDEWSVTLKKYVPTEHVFLCSPGKASTPTPTGTYTAKPRAIDWEYDPKGTGEWSRFRSWASCYVNSCTNITLAIVFHSIPCTKPDYRYVSQKDIDLMGYRSSHGCVRLWPRQSEWIRKNCSGATVKIYYGPGKDTDLWYLRERLKKEAPPKEMWPNTVITKNTKFIYTYFGDTLESLAEMSGKTTDELIELNPGLGLKKGSVKTGLAVRIK